MRVVAALGGNALLERGEAPLAERQAAHVRAAVAALTPIAREHELVVTHGNGPQVGLLAVESVDDASLAHPYPLDVLGAETQGMVGYLLLQALENALPARYVASLVTQTVVDADDPAFGAPTKFVGPCYAEEVARRLAATHHWEIALDGRAWRRVVASPEPRAIVELETIRTLLAGGTVVVCSGGGGVPVVRGPDADLRGVEAVVDKDLAAALLAESLGADALLLLTDVPGVEADFGSGSARVIERLGIHEVDLDAWPAGSMRPKLDAACRFVRGTGRHAAIGSLSDATGLLDGTSGTTISVR